MTWFSIFFEKSTCSEPRAHKFWIFEI